MAKALNNRGICKGEADDIQGELADYTAVIELEGAPVEQVVRASANSVSIHLAEGRFANAVDHAAVAICSGMLPDGGLKMVDWFKGNVDELKTVVEDQSGFHSERGCALAILSIIGGENIKSYRESWLKDQSFEEASKVCMQILQIWKEHMQKAGDSGTAV